VTLTLTHTHITHTHTSGVESAGRVKVTRDVYFSESPCVASVAVCCRAIQRVAGRVKVACDMYLSESPFVAVCRCMLQCVAVCCIVLQIR